MTDVQLALAVNSMFDKDLTGNWKEQLDWTKRPYDAIKAKTKVLCTKSADQKGDLSYIARIAADLDDYPERRAFYKIGHTSDYSVREKEFLTLAANYRAEQVIRAPGSRSSHYVFEGLLHAALQRYRIGTAEAGREGAQELFGGSAGGTIVHFKRVQLLLANAIEIAEASVGASDAGDGLKVACDERGALLLPERDLMIVTGAEGFAQATSRLWPEQETAALHKCVKDCQMPTQDRRIDWGLVLAWGEANGFFKGRDAVALQNKWKNELKKETSKENDGPATVTVDLTGEGEGVDDDSGDKNSEVVFVRPSIAIRHATASQWD